MEIIVSVVIIAIIAFGSFFILRRNNREVKNDMAEMAPYKIEPAKQEMSLPIVTETVEQPVEEKPKKKAAKKAKSTAKKEPKVKIAK